LILFLGLLVYYVQVNRFRYAILAGAAMAGAVMVSYAKARAESLVPPSEVGFFERPERLILMIMGALANRMPVALWILAIGPNLTVIHRIVHTWEQTEGSLRTQADGGRGAGEANTTAPTRLPAETSGPPQILTRSAGHGD
jgi:CDP-diacylglycerol--glycerol-3-phosphate 3-phosphatidyltransferase